MKDYEQRLGVGISQHLWGRRRMLPDKDLDKANWDTQEIRFCVSLALGKEEPLQELL